MTSGTVESQGSQSQGQEKQAGPQRSRLIQRLLTPGENLPQFVQDMLTTQALLVAGTEAAAFIVEGRQDGFGLRNIAHIRPDQSGGQDMRNAALAAFQELLKPCVAQARDMAIEIKTDEIAVEPQFCLVTLLRNENQIVAACAIITRCRDAERAQQRLMSLQLVAGYFDMYTLRRNTEQTSVVAQAHQHVLQMASAVAVVDSFKAAATNLCNELATRASASRVALGWIKGQEIRVTSLSHTEEFDKKQELIKLMETVMEECVDQEEAVHYDPTGEGTQNVSRCAQALSRREGGNIVLSLPLRRQSEVVGVITMEFPQDKKPTPQTTTALSVAVDLLAPQLYDRHINDRWLITKVGLSLKDLGEKIVGPEYMMRRATARSRKTPRRSPSKTLPQTRCPWQRAQAVWQQLPAPGRRTPAEPPAQQQSATKRSLQVFSSVSPFL